LVEVGAITLEKLLLFTDRSNMLVTIDAPLFGSVMVFNGRILYKGASYVEPEKIGNSIGFPAFDDIVAEATRFWIVDENGIRRRKCRQKMAEVLEEFQLQNPRSNQVKTAKSV